MGHAESKELLLARWARLINDRSLIDLPYKIELNGDGVVEMSPASNLHAMRQGEIARSLGNALPNGKVLTECSILTRIGIRVPDVAWASDAFLALELSNTPFTQAPEICVEVRSPSNSDEEMRAKIEAYLAAGALEAWLMDEDGDLRYFTPSG